MKVAEISPVLKKLNTTSKDNYRPISKLFNFAKLFESINYLQLNDYMEKNKKLPLKNDRILEGQIK